MSKIIIVFISLQILFNIVQCRTNQDVIDDFEPVFEERHNEFTALEEKFKSGIQSSLQLFLNSFESEDSTFTKNFLPQLENDLKINATDYLALTGMDQHLDLIPHCINDLNATIETVLHGIIIGEQRACYLINNKKFQQRNDTYNDLLVKFNNEHKMLDVTKEECLKLNTPFDVQTCVINDLYTFYIPYLKDVSEFVDQEIIDTEKDIKQMLNNDLKLCYNIAKDDAFEKTEIMRDTFKLCVWFAANEM